MPTAADAVTAYREVLAGTRAEIVEFGIDALDRTGVPVWTAAAFLPGGRLRNGVGYGVDLDAAQASALGECVEVLWGSGVPEATQGRLAPGRVDPRELIVDAGSAYEPERDERLWVRATRLPAGDEVAIPLEFAVQSTADLPAGYEPLITPITNGLGAGLTAEAALEHALRELVQRDGNSVAYRALDRGVGVDVDLPEIAPGVKPVVKAAISDLGHANVYVVADDPRPPHPLTLTGCGEAADPDRDRAIAKAVRELCASRVRKRFNHGPLGPVAAIAPARYMEHVEGLDVGQEEPAALAAMLSWLALDEAAVRRLNAPALAVRERVPLEALPHHPGAHTLDLLVERGFQVLAVDLTPPGQAGPVRVVKALVPGLEVETMSYGRCGARNLVRLLEADRGIAGLGAPPPGALALPLPPEALEEHGPAWLSPAAIRATVGDLYPLYREPGRHAAPLAQARGARP